MFRHSRPSRTHNHVVQRIGGRHWLSVVVQHRAIKALAPAVVQNHANRWFCASALFKMRRALRHNLHHFRKQFLRCCPLHLRCVWPQNIVQRQHQFRCRSLHPCRTSMSANNSIREGRLASCACKFFACSSAALSFQTLNRQPCSKCGPNRVVSSTGSYGFSPLAS